MFAVMGRTAAVPVRSVGRVAVGASRMTVARAPSVAGGRPAARSMRLIGDDDRARSVVARAADDESAPAAGEPEFAFEPKKKSRPRRDGSKTKRAKIKVEGMAIEAAKGTAPVTFASASEEAYILFLFAYIVVIFGAGLFLAVSAFGILPENVDNWVTETLYPAYSPIVIGFLLFSSVYGLVKTRNDPDSASGR